MNKPDQDLLDELLLPGEETDPSRRSFLKLAGFGVASATLGGCSRGPALSALLSPTASAITTPGVPYTIATTCAGCSAACGVVARCRDGRPIKLEGNREHTLSRGGLCPTGQADVLSLYDAQRLRGPHENGEGRSWEDADAALSARLQGLGEAGGRVRLLTGTVVSPSTRAQIERFLGTFPSARHVEYDSLSVAAALDANAETHGVRALPRISLERAHVVASFGADFLGTWFAPVEHAAGWAAARRPDDGEMSRHWQLESTLSLTGGRADERVRLAPWETVSALAALVDGLAQRAGGASPVSGALEASAHADAIERLASELWSARGAAVVLCGANDLTAQRLTNQANELIGAYGSTLDLARPSLQRRGDDRALAQLATELAAGEVDLLLVAGCNPAYDRSELALDRARMLVSFARNTDETSKLASWVLPVPHALEMWDDAEPALGSWSLSQPTVPGLFGGRSLRATLARLTGDEPDDRALVEAYLRDVIHPAVAPNEPFERFLERARRTGFVEAVDAGGSAQTFRAPPLGDALERTEQARSGLRLVLYPKVSLGAGEHAHNPWLQELPDPVSRIVWDNYACVSPERAAALGVSEGDVVSLRAAEVDGELELPLHVQPGQHDDIVAVALGYGRTGTDRFARIDPQWLQGHATVAEGGTVGANAAPWLAVVDGYSRADAVDVELARSAGAHALARVQDYDRLELPEHLAPKGAEVRDAVHRTTLAALVGAHAGDAQADAHGDEHAAAGHAAGHGGPGLWPEEDHRRPGHQWAMAIDLTACTGCSACVIGCQAENNVPVVGRDEVRRHREMHWLRIDRYYQGDGDELATSHQPMLCQHCDNAPCEAVCPVLATVHSSEGLNQQVYNRCVGTRYCANTCPYKVRRFNWFNYPRDDADANHALNPDVTVRTRGVMEKCSFCVQRIQAGKSAAHREQRAIAEGEVQTACQQSCPTQAIVFGDLADPESAVTKALAGPRSYRVLEELNVRPSIGYLAEVRNAHESHGG